MKILGYNITIIKIEKPQELLDEQKAYIELNNLYLKIERRGGWLSLAERLHLEYLVSQAYSQDDIIKDWWQKEFQKLSGWLDV